MAKSNMQIIASPREKILASDPAIPMSKKSTTMAVEIKSRSGNSLAIVDFLIWMG